MNEQLNTSLQELSKLLNIDPPVVDEWPLSLTIDQHLVVYMSPLDSEQLVLFCSAGILPAEHSARALLRENLFSTDMLRPQLCLTHDNEKLLLWNRLILQGINGTQLYQALMRLVERAQEVQGWLEEAPMAAQTEQNSIDVNQADALQV